MLQLLIKKVLFSAFFIACILFNNHSYAQSNNEKSSSNLNTSFSCPKLSSFDKKAVHKDEIKLIVDGDTIYTKNGTKLKLIHTNASEINHNNETLSENYAIQSREALKQLFKNNSTVYWTYDQKQQDRYKRDLVFIFNAEGLFVNAKMINDGFSHLLITPPNQQFWQCLYSAEIAAIKNKEHIWSTTNGSMVSAKSLNKNSRFQAVQGIVTKIITDKNYRWIVLDNHLWVGVKTKDLKYFTDGISTYKVGSTLRVYGRVFEYYKKLRMSLRHQAMILPIK